MVPAFAIAPSRVIAPVNLRVTTFSEKFISLPFSLVKRAAVLAALSAFG
jgi:hypothetical protein